MAKVYEKSTAVSPLHSIFSIHGLNYAINFAEKLVL